LRFGHWNRHKRPRKLEGQHSYSDAIVGSYHPTMAAQVPQR
jgi:hypothetical protein